MEYGYFDDAAREYVITRPDTPSPWINYLGSEAFFTLLSNTGGGYSFYRDARLLRLTRYRYNGVPTDAGGQYFYLRDGDSVFTPGWMPVKTPLDRYECRHGLGYTRILGEKDGLRAEQTSLVPRGEDALVTRLTLENRTDRQKRVDVFSFVEFCLWDAQDDATNFQRNLSTGEIEVEGSAIYHVTEYRERRNHYAVYAVNAPVIGFDTDRETFLGAYNGFDHPAAVERGESFNSMASGWSPVGSHHLRADLAPGARVSYLFVLGFCQNPDAEKFSAPGVANKAPARALLSRFSTEAQFDAAFEALAAHWRTLLSGYQVASGDARLDRMVNLWHQYQCMVTFNLSRSASYYESGIGRGMGFRDSAQDLLGFVHMVPQRARQRLVDLAATQFPDGSAYHQYQPLTRRGNFDVGGGFNDDPLWLIFGAAAYVRETGDASILHQSVPFDNDERLSQPLMEHLRRSFHFTLDHLGPHGLPLIGRADWNDCLNLNCFSTTPGESFQPRPTSSPAWRNRSSSRVCSSACARIIRPSAASMAGRTRRVRPPPRAKRCASRCWRTAGTAGATCAPMMRTAARWEAGNARRARSISSRRAFWSWRAWASRRAMPSARWIPCATVCSRRMAWPCSPRPIPGIIPSSAKSAPILRDTRKTAASSVTTTHGSFWPRSCWGTADGPSIFTAAPVRPISATPLCTVPSPMSIARWSRPRRPALRPGQKQLADGHGGMDVLCHIAGNSRDQAGL